MNNNTEITEVSEDLLPDTVADQLKQVQDTITALKQRETELKQRLVEVTSDGKGFTTANGVKVTYRKQPARLDTAKFTLAFPLDQNPECYEARPLALSKLTKLKGLEALQEAGAVTETTGWTVSVK